ncbi:hypothetical protein JYU09_01615 [bacterium AH-315-O15]|nr:hypothetical protein [bacterium AH-315-O15]
MATKRAASQPRWYDELDAITAPLTKREAKIRKALPRQQATQFLRDWPRFGEIVWKYASNNHRADTLPSEKKSLDKEKKAANDALKALTSIDKQLDVIRKRWLPIWKERYRPRLDNHDPSDGFLHLVKGLTKAQREKITGFGNMQSRPAKRGRPPTPQTYLLDVLVAYFNHHNWKVTIHSHNFAAGPDGNDLVEESPFVKTACAVLGGDGLSVETRKRLIVQDEFYKDKKPAWEVYPTLNGMTPPLTPKRKRDLIEQRHR